jgi:hypothetical protein
MLTQRARARKRYPSILTLKIQTNESLCPPQETSGIEYCEHLVCLYHPSTTGVTTTTTSSSSHRSLKPLFHNVLIS